MAIFFCIIFLLNLAFTIEYLWGARRMGYLSKLAPPTGKLPKISIILAACNEEKHIEASVRSLCQLDYPDFELIVVNDRSTDKTPEILRRLHQEIPRFHPITIDTLPQGWLGKNHALWNASKNAQGEWFLFTDGDIIFEKDALLKAVAAVKRFELDHLCVFPKMITHSKLLNFTISVFTLYLMIYLRPWLADSKKSKSSMGVGGFNFVKRSTYFEVGGHKTVRLRPDEDIRLGKIIKEGGFHQKAMFGKSEIAVEWYASFSDMVKGLEKNVLAGADYQVWMFVVGTVLIISLNILPTFGCFFLDGPAWWFSILTLLTQTIRFLETAKATGLTPYYGPLAGLGGFIYLYVIWNGVLKTLYRGGIEWRGTFYSLSELKSERRLPE